MKTAATISLLAVALTVVAASTADAQVTAPDRKPTISRAERNKLVHFNTKHGIVAIAVATDLPRSVDQSGRTDLKVVVSNLIAGDTKAVAGRWSQVISATYTRGRPTDISLLINWVLRQAYMEANADLKSYADKVKYFNDAKKTVRQELSKMRRMRSDMAEYAQAPVRKIKVEPKYVKGKRPFTFGPETLLSRAELDVCIEALISMLQQTGDDAQLANIDLQNKLQQQQQTLQTISNVSKMLYGTAMTIIRKIG